MAPKARAKSVPKAKSKAKAEPATKVKAKAKASASAKPSTESGSDPASAPTSSAPSAAQEAILPSEVAAPAKLVSPEPPAAGLAVEAPVAGDPPPLPGAVMEEAPAIRGQEAPATRGQQLQDAVLDPWAALSDEAALAKVVEEAWDHVLEGVDDCNGVEGAAAHVLAKDAGLKALPASRGLARAAVSLDLSENALERADALPALWLRSLLLGSNPIRSLDGLADLFPRLLSIDLSFVDIPSIEGVWQALARCRRLRAFIAEDGGFTSFEDMEPMLALQSLELLENSVEELEQVGLLAARCPCLARLDLRENPVATEPGYAQAVRRHMPRLQWHDNQSLKKYVAKTIDKVGYANLNEEVNAVDGLYKGEHCSCLEGNPCLDPATCVDWAHRDAVAAEARRRKGLRDDFGKQL